MPYKDIDKRREANRKSYHKHKDNRLGAVKKYRSENRDWYRNYLKKYYLRNKEELIEKANRWRKDNPDKAKAIAKRSYLKRKKSGKVRECYLRWRKTAKGRLVGLRATAKTRGIKCLIVLEEFEKWWDEKGDWCAYCGTTEGRLGFDRVDNDKPYQIDNIVWACLECNSRKGSSPDWKPRFILNAKPDKMEE